MSLTRITETCSVNFDKALGDSVNCLMGIWVYFTEKDGTFVLNGGPYLYTTDNRIVSFWLATQPELGKHNEHEKRMSNRLRKKIAKAAAVEVIKAKMTS